MKYSEIRETIKTGDLIAWSEAGDWSSWRNWQLNFVRMGTMSEYNHVGIAYVIGGRVFVVDAVVPNVRIFPLSKLTPFRYIRTPFIFDNYVEEFMLLHVGTPYSKWEAFKAAFTSDTNNDKVIQCAKLVNKVFGQINPRYLSIRDTPHATVNLTMDEYDVVERHITP
jgi:hypothetical protein